MHRRSFLSALAAVPFAAVAALKSAPAFTRYFGAMNPASDHGLLALVDDGTYVSNYGGISRFDALMGQPILSDAFDDYDTRAIMKSQLGR